MKRITVRSLAGVALALAALASLSACDRTTTPRTDGTATPPASAPSR